MTDSSSNQIGATMKYLPFGEMRSGSAPTDKKFTGQRLDSTGLYYYNARYYDPTIGRFISPDTEGIHYSDPQSLNRYTYCSNNPLKYTDPSGHDGDDFAAYIAALSLINPGLAAALLAACTAYVFRDKIAEAFAWAWDKAKTAISGAWDKIKNAAGAVADFFGFGGNDKEPPKSKKDQLLDKASNHNLRNAINELYHGEGTVGDGGTADAIRFETQFGQQVCGRWHLENGMGYLRNLEKIMTTEKLSFRDFKIAASLYSDLMDAITGALFP